MRDITVSVLMPAYNAGRYLARSIDSVLNQTLEDFELLVVDDASSDETGSILQALNDPRVRVLRNSANLGIVGSLNRAMGEARGRLIARTDADDICLPTRLARQAAFLDQHSDVLLLGARMADLEQGAVRPPTREAEPDPVALRWQFHLGNPLGHPSMMFRREVVDRIGGYLRREFECAEDLDFSHRVLRLGRIAILPDTLMLYRRHAQSVTRRRQAEVADRAGAVLALAYAELLDRATDSEGQLVAAHFLAAIPVADNTGMQRLGATIRALLDAFAARHALSAERRARCEHHAAQAWWGAIQSSLRSGAPLDLARAGSYFPGAEGARPSSLRLGRSIVSGRLPGARSIARQMGRLRRPRPPGAEASRGYDVSGVHFTPILPGPDEPPTLAVVVDTEAEFDWNEPFDRSLTAVAAMSGQEAAQAIFDRYGLRPIYVVDYAVASQPGGHEPLRRILERHGCAIGAHLHPWTNPPFDEALSDHNSYGGNLPATLEEAKLRVLVQSIEAAFGVRPLFFKAGRYGLGPNTLPILARLGFKVDFSILPKADLRTRGGPDFSHASPFPCRADRAEILSLPMTREQIGMLAPLPVSLRGVLRSPVAERLRLSGLLSRLRLANTVTLSPEGVTSGEQIALIRALLRRGHRRFVLHYHSTSLVAGNTPYVRTASDLRLFLGRIEAVCAFFFRGLCGVPSHPADFLPQGERHRLWPAPAADRTPAEPAHLAPSEPGLA